MIFIKHPLPVSSQEEFLYFNRVSGESNSILINLTMAFSNTDQGFKIQIRHLEKNVNATVEQVKKYREEVVRRMEKATDGERLWSKYVKCLDLLRATLEARDELSDVEEELIQFDVVFGGPRNSTMVNDGQRDNNMENEVRAVRGNPNNEGCNGNNGSELHGLTVSRSSRRSSMESKVESYVEDGVSNEIPFNEILKSIPKFNGDLGAWLTFKETVQEVIWARRLSAIYKGILTAGLLEGEPKSIWSMAKASRKTMEECWMSLVDHYEHPNNVNKFIEEQISKLPFIKDESDEKNMKLMLEKVHMLKDLMVQLGPNHMGKADLIRHRIASRFWLKEATRLYAYNLTLESMADRIEVLIKLAISTNTMAELTVTDDRRSSIAKSKPSSKATVAAIEISPSTSRTLPNDTARIQKCSFCSRGHWSSECDTDLSMEEKSRMIHTLKLCSICFKTGHKAIACFRKGRVKCRKCGESHATTFHGENRSGQTDQLAIAAPITVLNSTTEERPNVIRRIEKLSPNGEVGLMIKGEIKGVKCEILLDSGATISVIHSRLADKDNIVKTEPIHVTGFMENIDLVVNNKAKVNVVTGSYQVKMTGYVSNDIPEGRVIVGLDQLYMYLKPGKRILETICGDYCFEKRQFISRMGRVPSIEQDEPEEVHEEEMKVQVMRQTNGRSMIKLPFFSSVRPPPNFKTAIRSLQFIISELSQDSQRLLSNAVYMDDPNTNLHVLKEAVNGFNASGFELNRFRSNCKEINRWSNDQTSENKIQGVQWNADFDTVLLNWITGISMRNRRQLLSYIGRNLDPMGITDAVKLKFRLSYSRNIKLDWDVDFPDESISEIQDLVEEASRLTLTILRQINRDAKIYAFRDSSQFAYGYVMYQVEGKLQSLYEVINALKRLSDFVNMRVGVSVFSDSKINTQLSPNNYKLPDARFLVRILKFGDELGNHFHHIDDTASPADPYPRGRSNSELMGMKLHRLEIGRIEATINSRPILKYNDRLLSAFELSQGRSVFATGEERFESWHGLFKKRSAFMEDVDYLWRTQYIRQLSRMKGTKMVELNIGDVVLVPERFKRRSAGQDVARQSRPLG
ncbi:hypothetical protein BLOT_012466 [Blomia tropicalis]|nr:hypothetical protein BLOT_012466 [Blomia tropicalis]